MTELGTVTPQEVSDLVNFDRNNPRWRYRSRDRSMFAKQAEGVAHIWNLLSEKAIALLADEVGMGKTLQALSVCALLWRIKPDARILVIAPREVVAVNWQSEFFTFLSEHYRWPDDIVKTSVAGRPIHEFIKCRNLPDLLARAQEGCRHFLLAKTTSFSYVNNEFQDRQGRIVPEAVRRVFGTAAVRQIPKDERMRAEHFGRRLREALTASLAGGTSPFDLLIVDEAHYYRARKRNGSLRVHAASGFFGDGRSGRIAERVLLLTATPNHTSLQNVETILSYFVKPESLLGGGDLARLDARDRAERLLRAVGLRRYRRLAGKMKYQYRSENAVASSFADSRAAELFYALYQKRLVQELTARKRGGKGTRKLFFGYLEGFESFNPSAEAPESAYDEERRESTDFAKNWDSEILKGLSDAYRRCYGCLPSHPKYDKLVEGIAPHHQHYWRQAVQKNLIFVRRIPSLREITQRVIDIYDKLFWDRILEAWRRAHPQIEFRDFQSKPPSRWTYYTRFSMGERGFEEDEADLDEEAVEQEEEPETDIPQSVVLDFFTVKKKGRGRTAAYTHATSFRVRFVRDESLFSLFFQPALDYRAAPYRKIVGYRTESARTSTTRIYYDTSCGMARLRHPENRYRREQAALLQDILYGEKVSGGGETILEVPAETLWSIMWNNLEGGGSEVRERIQSMSPSDREGLALYLRKGILFASASLIELYCWFIQAQGQARGGEGLDLYDRFVSIVKKNLAGSLLFKLWCEAVLHYELFTKKILGIGDGLELLKNQRRLNVFNNMNPIYPYSGDTKNPSVIAAFNSPFFPEHLVATSVLQEGVNLQYFCKNVHHYGIAWTPGDNEQRAGRIDRMFSLVEKELERGDDTSLNIYYPYIRNTIDEDQVGEFVFKKYQAELLMDRCLQGESSREVESRELLGDNWRRFLRAKNPTAEAEDPYKPRLKGVVSTFSDRDRSSEIGGIDDLSKKLRGTLSVVMNRHDSGERFAFYDLWDKSRSSAHLCLLDPKLGQGRRQPVLAELNYSSALSGFDPGTVYYLTLKTPLSSYTEERRQAVRSIEKAYMYYRRRYPLVQLVYDRTVKRTSYFAIHMKVDLLLFRDAESEHFLSEKELELAFRQLIEFSDRLERRALEDQDISDGELVRSEWDKLHPVKSRPAGTEALLEPSGKRSKERIAPSSIQGWRADGGEVITRVKSFGIKERKWKDPMEVWSMNLAYPFVIFEPVSKEAQGTDRFVQRLSYPSVDLQKREIDLLTRWFDFAYRSEVRG